MNREELSALRDAIDVLLAWPPAVRDQVAAWLKPEASARPNGFDPNPTKITPTLAKPKARRHVTKFAAKTAEQKLIAAMRDNSELSVIALANATNAGRSATGERLRQLAERGVVEKSATGRWRLKDAEPGPTPPPSP